MFDAECPTNKIDSNFTGLRYAWEECLKQLPAGAAAVWHALEPNSYAQMQTAHKLWSFCCKEL